MPEREHSEEVQAAIEESRKQAEFSLKKGLERLQKPDEEEQELGMDLVGSAVEKLFGNHQFAESLALLDEAVEGGKMTSELREVVLQKAVKKELRRGESFSRSLGNDSHRNSLKSIESHFGGNTELQGMALREVQKQNKARIEYLKKEQSDLEKDNAEIAAALEKEPQA